MSDQLPAALVDKYKVGRVIGEGNFSVVKQCVRKTDGVQFAVKCINKLALNPKDRSNLVQEINILKELDHPNIIKLFDVYDDDTMCYLVMEFAIGGELFDRIIAKEYYTEAEAKRVVKVVAKVLKFCHAAGVTHRDLKPENLLYADTTPDAAIKIADFGFAKLVTTAETNMSTMCGTPGYYAPEIVRKQPYDNKCDIWSLGVITYILLCGFPPFYDENQVEEMRKILHADFEFVEPYFDDVSPLAKDLIHQMLVVDPTQRLSATAVLTHPWFSDCLDHDNDDSSHVLSAVGKKLKEAKLLTTRSKFRAGVGAVMAVNKTRNLLNLRVGGRAST